MDLEPRATDRRDRPRPEPAAQEHEAAVQRHVTAVWRYLRALGAAPAEAEELVQEAFVTALGKDALSAAPAALRAFLRRTARFLWLRRHRGRPRETAIADAIDLLWQQDRGDDGGGDGRIAAARACVEQLDGRARRAVQLAYGLDGSEPSSRVAMARELGLQENGVKTLMQRVRSRLRECIERRMRR